MLPLTTLISEISIVTDEDLIEGYLKRIYEGAIKRGGVDAAVWRHNYKQLRSALQKGWGKDFASIDYNTPDYKFIQQLKSNSASFAAFKNHDETIRIAELLLGDNGKQRPWTDFRDEALKVSEEYNVRWLQTEFNHAAQSARMAKKWKDFEEDSDLYPNLMYIAVQDDRTRPEHAEMHGSIYPINDPFWDEYMPPNDWGCRCTVRQSDADPKPAKRIEEIPDGFKNNPGKSGEVFDKKGVYYQSASAKERKQIDKLATKYMKDFEEEEYA